MKFLFSILCSVFLVGSFTPANAALVGLLGTEYSLAGTTTDETQSGVGDIIGGELWQGYFVWAMPDITATPIDTMTECPCPNGTRSFDFTATPTTVEVSGILVLFEPGGPGSVQTPATKNITVNLGFEGTLVAPVPVPLPASMLVGSLGLLAVTAIKRRRAKSAR